MLTTVELSQFIAAWNNGDRDALGHLFPLVYNELRRQARRSLSNNFTHEIQATDLVHNLFIVLERRPARRYESKRDFVNMVTKLMCQLLLEYHGKKCRRIKIQEKVGHLYFQRQEALEPEEFAFSRWFHEGLEKGQSVTPLLDEALEQSLSPRLHEVLGKLRERNKQQFEVLVLKWMCDLKLTEIASVLELTQDQVRKRHVAAKGYVRKQMKS